MRQPISKALSAPVEEPFSKSLPRMQAQFSTCHRRQRPVSGPSGSRNPAQGSTFSPIATGASTLQMRRPMMVPRSKDAPRRSRRSRRVRLKTEETPSAEGSGSTIQWECTILSLLTAQLPKPQWRVGTTAALGHNLPCRAQRLSVIDRKRTRKRGHPGISLKIP